MIGQLVGGGAGGAILTAIIGAIKNARQVGLRVPSPMAIRKNSLRVMVGACGSVPWPRAAELLRPDR